MTTVKAAAVQVSPVLYSREGTVDKVVQKINELGGQGVQFATFGETLVPYYPYFSFVERPFQMDAEHLRLMERAVTVPSDATRAIGEASQHAGLVVSVGVNERDRGTLDNTQLLFDADGSLIQRRRKITPTYHERMVWGQGDGSGLRAVDSAVGRIGQLACWEHYSPLARYALMADGEQIHSAMYPGSFGGDLFSKQIEVNIRQHALEARCFVVCATAWLDPDQQAQIVRDTGCPIGPISSGCFTAIVSPQSELLGEPLRSGEGVVIADLNFRLIDERKRLADPRGIYTRPELLSLLIDRTPTAYVHERSSKFGRPMSDETVSLAKESADSSQLSPETRRIQVDRRSVTSARSFDEIVSALDAAIGHPNVKTLLSEAEDGTPAEMKATIEKALGPSGFMEFIRFDPNKIFAKETGDSARIRRFVIGNPLVMKEMVKHVPDATSYAPVTILVAECPNSVRLSYDTMASFIAPYGNEKASEVARDLDNKVESLITEVAR